MPAVAQVEVTAQARADIARLVLFLDQHSPAAAERLEARILSTLRAIAESPQAARRWPDASPDREIRERLLRLGRSTYLVRYQFTPGLVTILRLHHSREDRGGGLEG